MGSYELIPLPPEIEVERLRDGTRYTLPPRDMGRLLRRLGGAAAFVGGLIVVSGIGLVGYTTYRLTNGASFDVRLVAECLFGLPLFFMGLGLLNIGRKLRGGHNRLVVTSEKLTTFSRPHLPWAKRKSIRLDHVDSLGVSGSGELPLPGWLAPLRGLGGLGVKAGNEEFVLAWGYPTDWLISLAQHVGEVAVSDLSTHPRPKPIPIEIEDLDSTAEDHQSSAATAPNPYDTVEPSASLAPPPEQPRTSNAVLKTNPDGCAIELPARGIWKASKGLIAFAVFWLAITVTVSGGFFSNGIGGKSGLPVTISLVLIPFFGLFYAIGIAILVTAYNNGRKRSFIDVVQGDVLVTTKGLFGLKQYTWTFGELKAVRVGESGTEVNDEPLMNLHFVGRDGKTVKLFVERLDTELEWLASLITYHLQTARR